MEDEVLNNVSDDLHTQNEAAENEIVLSKPDYESEILGILRSNNSPKNILNKLEV